MSSNIVITLAAIGGIAWLGFILVNALRRRGPEEIPSNLAPGTTDDAMETRRLETTQKTAVLLSAFLAVSLPLYFLGEQDRQEGFVDQFDEESVSRGEALVVEYACFDCHGPDGTGGVAEFVEPHSGVTVEWAAPSLDDVFYRYEAEEVNYWVTFGRGNTPMPPWGVEGGGPMNEAQVEDVVNYLQTIQKPQEEVVGELPGIVSAQTDRLANAESTAEAVLARQRQVLAEINQAPDQAEFLDALAQEARSLLDQADAGIDTDGDGLADSVETRITEIGQELVDGLRVIDPVELDPENPQSVGGTDDLTTARDVVEELESLVESGEQPILFQQAEAARAAFDGGVVDPETGLSSAASEALAGLAEGVDAVEAPSGEMDLETATGLVEEIEAAAQGEDAPPALTEAAGEARAILEGGQDPDGDGLSTEAEQTISTQVTAAIDATLPPQAATPQLDPTNEATGGQPDAEVADSAVANWETLALNTNVTANNIDNLRDGAQQGVAYLEQALEEERWAIDIEGVAEAAFDGDTEQAERAVLLFNGYCARCHTAGYSAGVPFTYEAGAGGFGPALWDGRPVVQFGEGSDDPEEDLLVQFIINGSEDSVPYGLNGFGSGRMPAFGEILPLEDIQLLARYLRGSDLTGMSDEEVGP